MNIKTETRIEINVRGREMYVNNGTETESAIPRIALRINFILK